VAITFDDGYLDTLTLALPLLLEYGFTAACYIVTERVGLTSDWTDSAPLMDWPEIRIWLAGGMEVGSHSLSHRALPGLPAHELREEVQASRARLEDRLGLAIHSFAYPFNRVGRREMEAVRAAGYTAGCAGPEISGSVLALTRVGASTGPLARFLVQLLPVYPELRHFGRSVTLRRAQARELGVDALGRLS
jgi:peptidoglycan/xylan/chitin deacetylase (PgdA/CDA1 family)